MSGTSVCKNMSLRVKQRLPLTRAGAEVSMSKALHHFCTTSTRQGSILLQMEVHVLAAHAVGLPVLVVAVQIDLVCRRVCTDWHSTSNDAKKGCRYRAAAVVSGQEAERKICEVGKAEPACDIGRAQLEAAVSEPMRVKAPAPHPRPGDSPAPPCAARHAGRRAHAGTHLQACSAAHRADDGGPCARAAAALEVARGVLAGPAMAGLELFLLRAQARRRFLEIRLDQARPRRAPRARALPSRRPRAPAARSRPRCCVPRAGARHAPSCTARSCWALRQRPTLGSTPAACSEPVQTTSCSPPACSEPVQTTILGEV